VNLLSNASGSKSQDNTKNDRIQRTPRKVKKNKLEEHLRTVRPSLNKKSVVDTKATSSVTNSMSYVNSDLKCASYGSTGSPSSTRVDQDAPSASKSHTTTEIQSSVIPQEVEEDNLDIEVHHMGNDPPVSTRLQLHGQALFCYYDAFLTSVEPKTYKEVLTQSCWIEAMQEELNEFERLEVWELLPRPDKVMVITL
nr:integrase, catalytic region, zinc finger, CCHC-type, peptidase aspartic, catalytic [Tanacetum cinerariifolium]